MQTSFQRAYSRTVVFSVSDPTAGHCRPKPPQEVPRKSQASLTQSSVGSLLLSPGSWCTQGLVCALQESVFPVLWKFCNQLPLAFKVKFPRGSQSLCSQAGKSAVGPRTGTTVGKLLWYSCSPVVGYLLGSSMVGLTQSIFQVCCTQSPCLSGRPLMTHPSTGDSQTLKGRSGSVFCGVSGSWCTQGFFFEPSEHLWCVWSFFLNAVSPLLPSSPLPLDIRYIFLVESNTLLSVVVQQ